ncbi:MAG: S8 family serine peptidase [Solirubrobacteraceae bacterium]
MSEPTVNGVRRTPSVAAPGPPPLPLSGGRLGSRWRALAAVVPPAGVALAAVVLGATVAVMSRGAALTRQAPAPVVPAVPLRYTPRTLVVGFRGTSQRLLGEIDGASRSLSRTVRSPLPSLTPAERLITLPRGVSVLAAAGTVAALPGVTYAVPDYIAHAAGDWYPDDPGRGHRARGWEKLQWNFMPADGVNAPQAWANLRADQRPGASGTTIAVVDTGVAFRNWGIYRRSPDFTDTRFVDPCDLVRGTVRDGRCTDPYAVDRDGHGTFVAGMIAESTNNGIGVTGLAYHARIMPVRVLNANGNGNASTIAAGIRYAVRHGAQVINLSIEFSPGTKRAQIPELVSAVRYANRHGVVLVGAAGNDAATSLDYPAALPQVISVGATTADTCLSDYSDTGRSLDLVAPGGGEDAISVPGSRCHPNRNLPDVYQMTFENPAQPWRFGLPGGWFGTSMAAPEVSAAAAMVIASGVIGSHPTSAAILARLEATARPLGSGRPNDDYGYGLVDIGRATLPGGPSAPSTTTTTPVTTTTTSSATVTAPATNATNASREPA